MGNTLYPSRMVIDRIITAEPYPIYIGVSDQVGSPDNPFKDQVIRLNDNGELKSLVFFTETNNSLNYEFEDNIHLKLMKREDNKIIYQIKSNNINHTSMMNDIIRKNTSKISLKSNELDKIFDFIKMEK